MLMRTGSGSWELRYWTTQYLGGLGKPFLTLASRSCSPTQEGWSEMILAQGLCWLQYLTPPILAALCTLVWVCVCVYVCVYVLGSVTKQPPPPLLTVFKKSAWHLSCLKMENEKLVTDGCFLPLTGFWFAVSLLSCFLVNNNYVYYLL